jgi:hypothetical protein
MGISENCTGTLLSGSRCAGSNDPVITRFSLSYLLNIILIPIDVYHPDVMPLLCKRRSNLFSPMDGLNDEQVHA